MPPETLLQGTGSGIRSRWPVLWPAVIGAFGVIAAAGLPVLLMNIPGSARLAIWIALAGFASNALLANIENVRYAFPLHALAVLAAAAVCDRVLHLLGRRLRSRKERGSPAGA